MSKFKKWFTRNLYGGPVWSRHLMEFPAVCDICNTPVGWSDYGYMCKKHGDVFYKTFWKYLPKFLFKILKGGN